MRLVAILNFMDKPEVNFPNQGPCTLILINKERMPSFRVFEIWGNNIPTDRQTDRQTYRPTETNYYIRFKLESLITYFISNSNRVEKQFEIYSPFVCFFKPCNLKWRSVVYIVLLFGGDAESSWTFFFFYCYFVNVW